MAKLYRITTFGRPRSPWRESVQEAVDDAVELGLASWDASRREWFLAVPVDLVTGKAEDVRGAA